MHGWAEFWWSPSTPQLHSYSTVALSVNSIHTALQQCWCQGSLFFKKKILLYNHCNILERFLSLFLGSSALSLWVLHNTKGQSGTKHLWLIQAMEWFQEYWKYGLIITYLININIFIWSSQSKSSQSLTALFLISWLEKQLPIKCPGNDSHQWCQEGFF